jgi:hypothetical protein
VSKSLHWVAFFFVVPSDAGAQARNWVAAFAGMTIRAIVDANHNNRNGNSEGPHMLHTGGCHCANIKVKLQLSKSAEEMPLRSCSCGFCRSHGTRTVSDRDGSVEITAADWSLVERYRFGSRTADYLLCRRCGVYVGAVCQTGSGLRAVMNVNCLDDRAAFTQTPAVPDYGGETTEARLDRRAMNWMPAAQCRD